MQLPNPNHAMKINHLCVLNHSGLETLRILNIHRLNIAVQLLLRALFVVLKRERPQEKLYSYVRHVISRARRVSLPQINYASPN
jgi:hypothetical protein